MYQVPKLATAAEYFFKMGVEGKRFRPTVSIFSMLCRCSCILLHQCLLQIFSACAAIIFVGFNICISIIVIAGPKLALTYAWKVVNFLTITRLQVAPLKLVQTSLHIHTY